MSTPWRKAFDPFGASYYYNSDDRVSTWDAPDGVDISTIPIRSLTVPTTTVAASPTPSTPSATNNNAVASPLPTTAPKSKEQTTSNTPNPTTVVPDPQKGYDAPNNNAPPLKKNKNTSPPLEKNDNPNVQSSSVVQGVEPMTTSDDQNVAKNSIHHKPFDFNDPTNFDPLPANLQNKQQKRKLTPEPITTATETATKKSRAQTPNTNEVLSKTFTDKQRRMVEATTNVRAQVLNTSERSTDDKTSPTSPGMITTAAINVDSPHQKLPGTVSDQISVVTTTPVATKVQATSKLTKSETPQSKAPTSAQAKPKSVESKETRMVLEGAVVPENWITVIDKASIHKSLAVYYYSLNVKQPTWKQPLGFLKFQPIQTSIFRSLSLIQAAKRAMDEKGAHRYCTECYCHTAEKSALIELKASSFKTGVNWLDERLVVSKTPSTGLGLKCLTAIASNNLVGILHGEITLREDWDKEYCVTGVPSVFHMETKDKDIDSPVLNQDYEWTKWDAGNPFFFVVDDHASKLNPVNLVINCEKFGNLTRFINHSCEPNLVAKIVHRNGYPSVTLHALRNINAQEELTLDYLDDLKRHLKAADKLHLGCRCNSRNCRLGATQRIPRAVTTSSLMFGPLPQAHQTNAQEWGAIGRITSTMEDVSISMDDNLLSQRSYLHQFAPSSRKATFAKQPQKA